MKKTELKTHLQEVKTLFEEYAGHALASLDIMADVNAYYKGKFKGKQKEFDEIDRDILVFKWRVNNLISQMNELSAQADKMDDSSSDVQMLHIIDEIVGWLSRRSEFHKSFHAAESKWEEVYKNCVPSP